ncbi:hypothetical protein [Streptomyces griseomycini]|uniref:Uncharacterized protein n=1 Tax=Streptomyces griseomycini TaxID=66895 RepID=A0A7W7PWQ7_9ACTN|nr:hypothetical protein [Streptomyces griseomycini]MBB4902588.1 hypothetical protein [Streptomyces griseomycini]GGR54329.1 hypothetical protein GCM10015536_69590 [Streptomyces griseomycini]
MITATERAEAMALQVFISARLHNDRVITHDLVDAVMSRDALKEQGKANKETVRRIIRKRAASERCRVIFTDEERYWAIREQLHHMSRDEVQALRDSIADGGHDDPRGWDRVLNDAISVRLSNRPAPRRLDHAEPVTIRLWKQPRHLMPFPEDVVDAPHTLYIDGVPRREGIPAARIRTIVNNRRFAGRPVEQDATGAIICDTRRYAPQRAAEEVPTVREQQREALARIQAKADAQRAEHRAEMDDRIAAEHQEHGAPAPAAVQARIDARTPDRTPARRVLEGLVVTHDGTATGSTPSNAAHPNVVAARAALDNMAAATMTEHHDVTEPTGDEVNVRGYLVQPREGDRVAVYWLEGGRIVRHDDPAFGPSLDCLSYRLECRGWTVEPMLRSSLCVFAHRPAEEQRPAVEAHQDVAAGGVAAEVGRRVLAEAGESPADSATLFVALAAYESTVQARLTINDESLTLVARHLLEFSADHAQHAQIMAAYRAVDDARSALEDATGLTARAEARKAAIAAVEQARTVILSVAPRAHRMHGTDMPATAPDIRAAALAYNAVESTREELSAIVTGTPKVRVHCASDSGTGWSITATITAGVDTPQGMFIPAHPPLVVKFPRRDGREDAAVNTHRVISSRFLVGVPVEYVTDRRP